MTEKSKKLSPLKLITFVIVSIFIYFSLFPIDITNKAGDITSQLEDKFNGKIEIKRALLYPVPYPRIRLKDFKVTNSDGAFLSTKEIKINIDLFPLLTKKIVIKKLTFIESSIVLEIKKDGNLKIKGQKDGNESDSTTQLPPIYVENSSLTILDETHKEGFAYSMHGISATLKPRGDIIDFSLEGFGTNEGRIQVSGDISKNKHTTSIKGSLEAQHVDIEPFNKYFDIKNKFTAKEGIVSSQSSFGLIFGEKGTEVSVEGTATYNNLTALIPQAISKDFVSQSGSLDFTVSRKNKVTDVTLNNIHSKLEGFDLNGDIIIGKQGGETPRGITIKLFLTPMPIDFAKDIQQTVQLSKNTKKWTNALNLKTGHIELKDFNFYFNFLNRKTKLLIEMDFQDVVMGYKRVKGDFTDLWGSLTIKLEEGSENTITLKTITAINNKSAFTINGTLRDFTTSPYLDMSGDLNLTANIIEPLADAFNFEIPVISNIVNITGTFKGPIGELELDTVANFINTDLIYRRIINKPIGYPLTIKTLMTQERNSYRIKEGLMTFGDSYMNFNGLVQNNPSEYRLAIKSDNIAIKDIGGVSSYITPSEDSKGTIQVDISTKKIGKNNIPTYEGKISGDNLNFTTPMLVKKISNTKSVIRFHDNEASIILHNGEIGESKFSGKAEISDINEGLITFNLISPYLHVEDIIPEGSGINIEPYFTDSGTVFSKRGSWIRSGFSELLYRYSND